MLRITQRVSDRVEATLTLEGSLSGPWVGELDRAVESCCERGLVVRLDLAAVHYVDALGQIALQQLLDRQVEIGACSMFVAELLGRNRS